MAKKNPKKNPKKATKKVATKKNPHLDRPDLYYAPDFLVWLQGQKGFAGPKIRFETKTGISAWDAIDAFVDFWRKKIPGITNAELLDLFDAKTEDLRVDDYGRETVVSGGIFSRKEKALRKKYSKRKAVKKAAPKKAARVTVERHGEGRMMVGRESWDGKTKKNPKKNPYHARGSARAKKLDPRNSYEFGVIDDPDEIVEGKIKSPDGFGIHVLAVRVGKRWADAHPLGGGAYGVRFWMDPSELKELGVKTDNPKKNPGYTPSRHDRKFWGKYLKKIEAMTDAQLKRERADRAKVLKDRLEEPTGHLGKGAAILEMSISIVDNELKSRGLKKNPKKKLTAAQKAKLRGMSDEGLMFFEEGDDPLDEYPSKPKRTRIPPGVKVTRVPPGAADGAFPLSWNPKKKATKNPAGGKYRTNWPRVVVGNEVGNWEINKVFKKGSRSSGAILEGDEGTKIIVKRATALGWKGGSKLWAYRVTHGEYPGMGKTLESQSLGEAIQDAVDSFPDDVRMIARLSSNPKKNPKKKATKKNPGSDSRIIDSVSKWYEKKSYMTPEIKRNLDGVEDSKRFLARLYNRLCLTHDEFVNWMSFRPISGDDWSAFEEKTGIKKSEFGKFTNLNVDLVNELLQKGASSKTDKGFRDLSDFYEKAFHATEGDEGLYWYGRAMVPLYFSNKGLSNTWKDIKNSDKISGTLDYILKDVVSPRFMGGSARARIVKNKFQEAITFASSRPASNPKKKATKKVTKKKAAKKTTRKATPKYQLLINRCQKLWDVYCTKQTKKSLREVFAHLERMKSSTSEKVKKERARCLRAANNEAKRLKLK